MMKKLIMALAVAAVSVVGAQAQSHSPKLPPVGKDQRLTDYADNGAGFWCAVQLGGYASTIMSHRNVPVAELDLVGGYRFNQWFRAGLGLGGRHYFMNSDLRYKSERWSLPLYANFRGNFIDDTYRDVVPYYSFDIGAAIGDGFMFRPAIGIRVGQPRSAFTLGLNYMGQSLRYKTGKDRFVSFVGLTVGYEY